MRSITRLAAAAALLVLGQAAPAAAEISDGVVRIGVLSDMSGVYSDLSGKGSVLAAQMAVGDCMKAECAGMRIEVLSADHLNKADVALGIARRWIDEQGVDVLVDMGNASIQLAIPTLLRDKNRVGLFPGGTARLTGDRCMPSHIVHWMWDTYGQVAGVANQLTQPGTRWFLITADYAFGHQFEADAKTLVTARGGTVIGSARHPFPATDLSSQFLTAQSSGADVIALANAGGDTLNSLKAARDFGIMQGPQKLTAFFLTALDVHSIGLETAQGTILTEAFYWNLDDRTRAFSERFHARHPTMPSTSHAGVYSSVLHYLKAVAASGSDEARTVIARMHELPVDDATVRNATLREDGRLAHDAYVFQVKKPSESKGEWDVYNLVATIPASQASRPLSESTCPAVMR